jgi:hypothetical protein
VNIVEMIASQFGPQVVGAIANALGIEQNKAQSGISSSIPAANSGTGLKLAKSMISGHG